MARFNVCLTKEAAADMGVGSTIEDVGADKVIMHETGALIFLVGGEPVIVYAAGAWVSFMPVAE